MGLSKLRYQILVHLVIHLSPIFIGIVCYMYVKEVRYLEASQGGRELPSCCRLQCSVHLFAYSETTGFFLHEEILDIKILSQKG